MIMRRLSCGFIAGSRTTRRCAARSASRPRTLEPDCAWPPAAAARGRRTVLVVAPPGAGRLPAAATAAVTASQRQGAWSESSPASQRARRAVSECYSSSRVLAAAVHGRARPRRHRRGLSRRRGRGDARAVPGAAPGSDGTRRRARPHARRPRPRARGAALRLRGMVARRRGALAPARRGAQADGHRPELRRSAPATSRPSGRARGRGCARGLRGPGTAPSHRRAISHLVTRMPTLSLNGRTIPSSRARTDPRRGAAGGRRHPDPLLVSKPPSPATAASASCRSKAREARARCAAAAADGMVVETESRPGSPAARASLPSCSSATGRHLANGGRAHPRNEVEE